MGEKIKGFWSFLNYLDKHSYALDKKPWWEGDTSSTSASRTKKGKDSKSSSTATGTMKTPAQIMREKEEARRAKEAEAEQKQQTEELKKLTERLDELEKENETLKERVEEIEQTEEEAVTVIVQKNDDYDELVKRIEKLEKENEELKRQKEEKTDLQTITWPLLIEETTHEEITIYPDLVLALPEASSENREIILFKSENPHPPVPYDRKQDFERIVQKIHPERAGFFKALTDTLECNLAELKEMKATKYQMTIPLRFKNGKYYLTRFIRQFGNKDDIEIRMQEVFEYEYHSLTPKLKLESQDELEDIPKHLRIQAFERLLEICKERGINFLFSEVELETLKCANAMDEKKRSIPNVAKARFLSEGAIGSQNKSIKRKAVEHLGSYPFENYKDVIKFWEEQGLSFG